MDCKDQFISEIADTAAHKIARQVIMTLQRRKEARPSRDDAGWANRWVVYLAAADKYHRLTL